MADRAEPEDLRGPAHSAEATAEPVRVFISYASADKPIADDVCGALESAGIPCWIAPRDVKPGALYADAIMRAITSAKALVLVLSESSNASSHVGKEVERASSKKRPIIALRTDATPLTPALEYFLSESQWIDASATKRDSAYAKLIDAIRDPRSPATGDAALIGTALAGTTSSRQSRTWMMAGIAVVSLAVVAIIGVKFVMFRHASAEKSLAAASPVINKSIAVLPFADLSEKKDQGYFADGIAQEILDRLEKVPGLRVVGHVSSFRFKDKSDSPVAIGTALNVAYVLAGSVQKGADRVRVTAQLIDTRTGAQRWSDQFESKLVDVLQIQDSIATEIARVLQIAVEVGMVASASIKSPEALDAYLRGLQSLDRGTQEGCQSAVADFQQVLTSDPTFAPAAIGQARAYTFIGGDGWMPPKVAFERARSAAQLAQKLDPKSPTPHISMAEIHLIYDWDWQGADDELQQAFALGPRESYGLRTASLSAAARGNWDEARQLAIQAIALNPLDPAAQGSLGWAIYLRSGRLPEAEKALRQSLEISPTWGSGRYFLGEALLLQGKYDEALAVFRQETLDDGQLEGSAMVQFATGHKADSDRQLAAAIERDGTSWPSEIARVYAYRGEKGQALEWLDKAYKMRDEDLYFIKGDPLVKNLEADPRYKAFLRKMNLPQ
jgi:TolB-like protein/tetratricopeptide (TPR) repeat protein